MTLPGVGVFSGENTSYLVQELRRAGFQVRAVWAAGRKSAERIKRELNIECCTTDIKELVIRADVDLGKYFAMVSRESVVEIRGLVR